MQLKLRFMALLWRTVLSPFSIRLSPLSAHEERFLWCFLHSMMMIVWKMVSNWVAPATFVDRKVIFYGVSLRVNCLWCWWFHRFAYWKRRSVRFFSNKNHQSFMQKFFRAAACGHRYFLSLSLCLSIYLYLPLEKFVTGKAPKSRQCCLKHLSCVRSGSKREVVPESRMQNPQSTSWR